MGIWARNSNSPRARMTPSHAAEFPAGAGAAMPTVKVEGVASGSGGAGVTTSTTTTTVRRGRGRPRSKATRGRPKGGTGGVTSSARGRKAGRGRGGNAGTAATRRSGAQRGRGRSSAGGSTRHSVASSVGSDALLSSMWNEDSLAGSEAADAESPLAEGLFADDLLGLGDDDEPGTIANDEGDGQTLNLDYLLSNIMGASGSGGGSGAGRGGQHRGGAGGAPQGAPPGAHNGGAGVSSIDTLDRLFEQDQGTGLDSTASGLDALMDEFAMQTPLG